MRKTSLLSALCTVWLLVAPVLAAADGESWVTIAANKPKKRRKAARKKKSAKPAKEAAPAPKTSARSVQIQVRTGDKPMHFVSVSRMIDGKALKIESRDNGPIVVTRTERGKTVTRKFKNADELCKHDPEAYKLYKNVRMATQAKIRPSQGSIDVGPVMVIWPETMIPGGKGAISSRVVVGRSQDAKGAAAKAKAAAERCRKEAEGKRKQTEEHHKARQKAHEEEARERHRRHVEEQFEAQRKACEEAHKQRLKQLEEMRARTTESFERAIKSIEVQIKQEQQRHRAAMERLERMQEERK